MASRNIVIKKTIHVVLSQLCCSLRTSRSCLKKQYFTNLTPRAFIRLFVTPYSAVYSDSLFTQQELLLRFLKGPRNKISLLGYV